ncbi:AT-hook motif nuclear-localized protein 7-like [Gastrolobium bilobum]|uniref:AT-hook motif nuclear-localized protein 7-like n=1 Tax=Gastrolobium bilobum TaxID=150636 RepID=UPI002AB1F5F0|nr:AT-hook motif nuclear-localized protein 7-like [Gastrolobium bilobum]
MEETVTSAVPAGSSYTPPTQQVVITSVPQVMNMNVGITAGTATVPAVSTTAITPTTTTPATGFDLFGKKKRGRPRKYDSEGNLTLTYQKKSATTPTTPTSFTLSPTSPSEFSNKRGRGRPSGSGNWQLLASFGEVFASTAGGDFTPHVVTVYTGEDVAGKILLFAQKSPRGICILSANGAISNVTIRQPGSSGGILTYEGRFEILSLSGSFTLSDSNGIKSRTGGLSVSLAGPDGRVIGGGVAGLLTAAGPIQIVVGSFMPNGYKTHKRKYQREHAVASPTSAGPDTVTAARPIAQANLDGENILIPVSQLPDQSQREPVSVTSDKQNLDATPNAATWNGSEEFSDQRISPDINISLPDE